MLKKVYDVIIVGGGIMGLNIAYQMSRRLPAPSASSILVLERGASVGQGSTGASSAVCRYIYTHDEMIDLSVSGIGAYKQWSQYLQSDDVSASFTRTAGLWLTDESVQSARGTVARLAERGLHATVMDAADVTKRWPAMTDCGAEFDNWCRVEHECVPRSRGDNVAVVEESAGYFEPVAALEDLRRVLAERGVEVLCGADVSGVERRGDRVSGVETARHGSAECAQFVNAAGPWVNVVNRMAGIELPCTLSPTRIQVIYRPMAASVDEALLRPATDDTDCVLPFLVDARSGTYIRPQLKSRQLICSTIREEEEREAVPDDQLDTYNRAVDPETRDALRIALDHRCPSIVDECARIHQFSGLYTINRDDFHPVIGRPDGLSNVIVANGFSGHGFKIAPAVGAMVARIALDRAVDTFDCDVAPAFFHPNRKPIHLERRNVLA
jgi:glycine/D-amino acid oxidase-like deaminating enzyme